jgi:hypothetical protein
VRASHSTPLGFERMTEQSFSLIPFPQSHIPAIRIDGRASRQNGQLSIQYALTGEVENVFFPQKSISPHRKDGLWATTCFEFFLALPEHPQYWEFNVSPSGNWNIYRMEAYRRVGFREEISIQRLPVEVRRDAGCISLNAGVDLSPLILERDRVQLGISCVIQSIDQRHSYWALTHPHLAPDFHVRESFLIQL